MGGDNTASGRGICMSGKSFWRLSFGLVFLLGCAVLSEAALLRNVPVKVKQPDGAILNCLASGDEFYNWLHDKDGYTILRNPSTGFLVYANKVDGKLVPTEFIAGRTDVRTLEQAGIRQKLLDEPKPREKRVSVAQDEPIVNVPQTGTINNLVVYIRFSDQEDFSGTFVTNTAAFFNSADSGANSFRNYFTEASYGQLTIGSTFYPLPTANPVVYSYQDAHTRAYYMPYDSTTNPEGYNGETERRTREHTLLQSAVNAISADVPVGLNIDADADTYVDNICFVVKGEPTAWATLLWPHKWQLHSYIVYINGKRVWTYNFQLETTLDVGVLCHEMFHSLGAPDLYHDQAGSYVDLEPVWAWDLMEWNLNPPEHMGAYMKYKYGTWIPFIPEITTSGTYTLSPLTSATNNCYMIRSPFSSTEFFVLEYRLRAGSMFEGTLYNQGLLVYRINTACAGNFYGPPDEVYIYRPNGTLIANGEPWYAPFSSDQSRTQINDGTNPSSFLTGGTVGGLEISNVSAMGSTISFDVSIDTITVTSPNGGETWTAGGNATVTWMSTGTVGNVDILLTTNAGTSWTTLVANTANDGTETITVPAVSSSTCRIALEEAADGNPSDISDANFSIIMAANSITITAPNGGESWAAGTIHNVTWTQTGLTGSVTINLYKGGVYQKTLGTASATAGTFSWAIGASETAGTDYRVRVWQGAVSDDSDANFAIVHAFRVDFDKDGQEDILWRYYGTGEYQGWNVVWLMNQTGTPSPATLGANHKEPAEMNLPTELTPSIAYRTPLEVGTSRTSVQQKSFKTPMGGRKSLALKPKKIMRNPGEFGRNLPPRSKGRTQDKKLVSVPAMKDTAKASPVSSGTMEIAALALNGFAYLQIIPDTTWEIAGADDFNGDGNTDILWRNYGSGELQGWNCIWYMNGEGITGFDYPLIILDTNWRIVNR